MVRNIALLITACIVSGKMSFAQAKPDSARQKKWSAHFQLTVIGQWHPSFHALYNGENSLSNEKEPTAVSLTSTIFLGRKLWKGAALCLNPEISGGKGLSFATGVAGALNGETYRVGAVEPKPFFARVYFQQHIALSPATHEYVADDFNQVEDKLPAKRITITAGRFAISDYYDDNSYSKDPRTQFFNWSLWANGAWDYPANTRGYTEGLVLELIDPKWSIRLSSVAVPRIANSHFMEYKLSKAHSETLEFEYKYAIKKWPGSTRLIGSAIFSKAPSYAQGLKAIATNDSFLLNVISGAAENNSYGGKKFGIGLNMEQQLSNNIGIFSRIGWNDGKYASWAFTEIDRTFNLGISVKATKLKRPHDVFGLAFVLNGISKPHRDFLAAGGYGFIIGDGKLNYSPESIIESYYNVQLTKFLWCTLDYQFVSHPAYNKDRGPVHVFGIRVHEEL